MTDAIDAIAEKLIEAAYELYGRPPEAATRRSEYGRPSLLWCSHRVGEGLGIGGFFKNPPIRQRPNLLYPAT
jgi:hypothetical protein